MLCWFQTFLMVWYGHLKLQLLLGLAYWYPMHSALLYFLWSLFGWWQCLCVDPYSHFFNLLDYELMALKKKKSGKFGQYIPGPIIHILWTMHILVLPVQCLFLLSILCSFSAVQIRYCLSVPAVAKCPCYLRLFPEFLLTDAPSSAASPFQDLLCQSLHFQYFSWQPLAVFSHDFLFFLKLILCILWMYLLLLFWCFPGHMQHLETHGGLVLTCLFFQKDHIVLLCFF